MSLSFPLTVIEEFLFWEDRPAYPWSCFVLARFSGRLDQTALDSAILAAIRRHPLLRAKVEQSGRGHLRWRVVEDPRPVVQWRTSQTGGPFPPATHLDLTQEMGIRFQVLVDAEASDLVIQFHHACCDGIGIIQFLNDLLISYTLALGHPPKDLRLPDLEVERLARRGRFGLTSGVRLWWAPRRWVGLTGAWRFLMHSATPVIPHAVRAKESTLPADYPAVLSHSLTAEDTTALCTAAQRRDVTVNDLLVRDVFLALQEWRSRHNVDDGRWLRMMVPVNMRLAGDERLPAANVVSTVFLERRGPDFADPDGLLRGLHEEMDRVKRLKLGFTFVMSSELCRGLPGGLKRQVRADTCQVSCIVTNWGRLLADSPLPRQDDRLVAGNVRLENVETVAPNRPYTCVSFAVSLYAGRLTITLHYDPRPLTRELAADVLETFLRRLRMSIADNIGPCLTDRAPRFSIQSSSIPKN